MKGPVMRSRNGLRAAAGASAGILLLCGLTACGSSDSKVVTINIGYQSKTVDTVNAGTLLRERGTFEKLLAEEGKKDGVTYKVNWSDFPSGAPLTAAMIAGKVDIGSMGDYPALVNGSKSAAFPDAKSSLVAITGYNMRGSLNEVVVPNGSTATSLGDLDGKTVSTSLGSAGHGMLMSALSKAGVSADSVTLLNQDPPVGASALQAKQVDAYAQFIPWPQLMIFQGYGHLLYDGGSNDLPTMHAVIGRDAFMSDHPEVIEAYLKAIVQTDDYMNSHPLEAAQQVAEITGIPAEVIYLYNGPNGRVTYDPTIKPSLVEALGKDVPFLQQLGSLENTIAPEDFADPSYLKKVMGEAAYNKTLASTTNPDKLAGTDATCHTAVSDPATASEMWFKGQTSTTVAATPTCLLATIAASTDTVDAAYVPDALNATRMFASAAVWVSDPAASAQMRLLPFETESDAAGYIADHAGAKEISYDAALAASTTLVTAGRKG